MLLIIDFLSVLLIIAFLSILLIIDVSLEDVESADYLLNDDSLADLHL